MIAERFSPSDIESLVRIAATLADSPAAAGLSQPYRELSSRARTELVAQATGDPSPAVSALLGPRPGEQIWQLRIWNRHADETAPYSTEGVAIAELADHVRGSWDNLSSQEGIPEQPPADNVKAIELYYGRGRGDRPDEGYDLYAEDLTRPQRSRLVPLDFDFPGAAEADALNRAAVFHPADEYGPACVEVAGVVVFTYLDPVDGAVRVSVHLDSADPEHVVRPDDTVPLRIVVEDTVVLDDSTARAPHPTVLEELLAGGDNGQKTAIRSAAVSAGLMWACPLCQWINPRAATCCEGPSGCRNSKPSAWSPQGAAAIAGPVLALERTR
ncbi:hypothetical protein ACIBEA_38875 [Streptomyces sp. NPDC051555]|uniref:hypothetical protein n=1 Tax=Streptomyces sp. NPDC051555 TaxID=3365657 RepID=UPI0037ACDA98